MKRLPALLKQTFTAWNNHDAPRLAAALAFYTILSLAPLVVLVIAGLALAFGHPAAQDGILHQVRELAGEDGVSAVRSIIDHAQKPLPGIFASIVSLATLLFGASGVFGELRAALNTMWDVSPQGTGGVGGMIRERLFSFGMVLAIGFLLLVSLLLNAGVAAVGKFFGELLPLPEWMLSAINSVVLLFAISVLFALIFKYVPETHVDWKDVKTGAFATAVLFTIGNFLIGLYLGKAGVASAYGAAGSLMVVTIWIYYSAMLFFFGAELTHVLATSPNDSTGLRPPDFAAIDRSH